MILTFSSSSFFLSFSFFLFPSPVDREQSITSDFIKCMRVEQVCTHTHDTVDKLGKLGADRVDRLLQ